MRQAVIPALACLFICLDIFSSSLGAGRTGYNTIGTLMYLIGNFGDDNASFVQ